MYEFLANPIWSGIAAIATILFGIVGISYKRNSKRHSIKGGPIAQSHYEVNDLAERFLHVFKSHNIEHSQIPKFFHHSHSISLADLSSNVNLLNVLNDDLLSETCKKFGVDRDWLDGKDVPIYPSYYFDKQIESFIEFISRLKSEHQSLKGFAIKCPEDKLVKIEQDFDIALVFRGDIDGWCQSNGEPVWRYYPLSSYTFWGYSRTRLQFKAMVYIAYMFEVIIFGCQMTQDQIKAIHEGKEFPEPLLEGKSHVAWRPDDYVFCHINTFKPDDIEEAFQVVDLITEKYLRQLQKCEAINKNRLQHSKRISGLHLSY